MDYGLSHSIAESELVEGDHIYAWRGALLYSHQGIYVGQCDEGVHWVVHFVGGIKNTEERKECPLKQSCTFGKDSRPRGVSKICLSCFLQGCTLRRYKYGASDFEYRLLKRGGTCTLKTSDDPKNVVARANNLLQTNGFGHYNLFARNCESFALYCTTGDKDPGSSNQVRQGIMAAAAVATVVGFGIGYVLNSIYSYVRKDPEEEEQEEIMNGSKVPALAL